ncbi:unnamed protein product [Musa banksii]
MGWAIHLLFACFFGALQKAMVSAHDAAVPVNVGVILDVSSSAGKKSWTSISMAVDDFYATHSNCTTRVVLHLRNSKNDVVGAAAAAVDLLKNFQVQAIIGPETSTEASFVINLGNQSQVPVLSFSATSPSLSPARAPFFVRTTLNDSSQVGAIAAIVRYFGWREVVPVYEDSEYGAGVIPFLVDALQAVDSGVPYRSVIPSAAAEEEVDKELYKLMTMQTRVFIVHMLPALGARFFQRAKNLGMMSGGFVWITTDGITDVLEELDHILRITEAMQGVIAVRPLVERSEDVVNFTARFRSRFRQENPTIKAADPSVFQLWAYDTTWATTMAVENLGPKRSSFRRPQSGDHSTDLDVIGSSESGPALLKAILNTRFKGLAGDFRLLGGQLQSSAYEIVNVIGNSARVIEFWTPKLGISKQLDTAVGAGLNSIIWPGISAAVPKGWEIPTGGKKLRIGVPVKKGFNQFVNVGWEPSTNRTVVTGYCIDIFKAVMEALPYAVTYEFFPFRPSANSYDHLIYQVYLKNFDAVVGDTTITAERTLYVDFTMPYTESGVSMVVPVKEDPRKMWVFLKPLTPNLWLVSFAFFVFMGFTVLVIEHSNAEFGRQPSERLGKVFYFVFSVLVFSQTESLRSNFSRIAMVVWMFVVLILTSSYTASLTSRLTVQQLQPTAADLKQLLSTGAYIGYQDGSFAAEILKRMGFKSSKLRHFSTSDQYAEALLQGGAKGGVDAIFDEIPYLKLFLSEHCNGFTMLSWTYKTDGFGFVFQKGSPLVPDVSRAVLNVTEGDKMVAIQNKWFRDTICPSQNNAVTSASLNLYQFSGLFLITGVVSTLAALIFLFLHSRNSTIRGPLIRNILHGPQNPNQAHP